MLVGYNHNFSYNGVLYHVQTEDGGIRSPQVVTHLFNGGTILVTQKTSYADILSENNLEQVVQDLMKDQHREMLRRLKNGEFDDQIRARLGTGSAAPSQHELNANPKDPSQQIPLETRQTPSSVPSAATIPAGRETNLEDIVLSYFIGDQEKSS
jgi:hypothetical protein